MASDLSTLQAQLRAAPLRIGVSTRALFDLAEEHAVFQQEGHRAYAALQRARENDPLEKGAGFEVIQRLLKLNAVSSAAPYVEVILLSQNSPDLSLRAFKSADRYGLAIRKGSFTSGRSVAPYITAWGIDLFLSSHAGDVQMAAAAGTAAALLGKAPPATEAGAEEEVRIALDGDAVVFSDASDLIYKEQGLEAFLAHERENARNPMEDGPFGNFLRKLSILRAIYMDEVSGRSAVRIAIVTARNAPAHERVIRTLREWGTPADEAHFVGRSAKAPILQGFGAHIFFDDQQAHVLGAAPYVAAGHVPGPHQAAELVQPAG